MKIIFDREASASWGNQDDPNNTPEKIVQRREEMLREMGEFMDADSIEYKDLGKQESYIIKKKNKTLALHVSSTSFDGGWMSVNVEGEEN
jgi:hypothetical protein